MKNGKKENTSTYLVQSFLASEKSYELNINVYDMAILYTIARYLDMPKNQCFGKQSKLAQECRMSLREFKRRTNYLSENKVILRYLKGKLYQYAFGEKISGIIQEHEEISEAYWAYMSKNIN
jgi:hypothetical protein